MLSAARLIQMQGFSGRIFTPRGLGNLEKGKPAPNFLKARASERKAKLA